LEGVKIKGIKKGDDWIGADQYKGCNKDGQYHQLLCISCP